MAEESAAPGKGVVVANLKAGGTDHTPNVPVMANVGMEAEEIVNTGAALVGRNEGNVGPSLLNPPCSRAGNLT
jgi:hypothetical protein